jgi:peptidoglycan biosynthesis protein MviN/MurJ (putative lipid II flippase)
MKLLSSVQAWRRKGKGAQSLLLLAFTLAIGGVFKAAAFWRETYIAASFGVSADTDVYFGLQQFPLAILTFTLGAFGLAFTPAYSRARQTEERSIWTGGILTLALLLGLAGSAITMLAEPLLLEAIHAQDSPTAHLTLLLLSLSYAPILVSGLWVCMNNAAGRSISSLTVTGLPYLLMTLSLVVLCLKSGTQTWSLPGSWLAGFLTTALVGISVIAKAERIPAALSTMFALVKLKSFRRFLGQLGSSVLENAGFISNQLLMVSFFGMTGPGAITANNYAMRIGMLGFGILTIPISQLTQSRLCTATSAEVRRALFIRQLTTMALVIGSAAAILFFFREDVGRLVYLRGQFSAAQLQFVVSLLPAWLSYFVVISLNAVASRMLFVRHEGMNYTRSMLCAYGIANLLRVLTLGHTAPAAIIWSSVIAEGAAFLWNVRRCLMREQQEQLRGLNIAATPVSV